VGRDPNRNRRPLFGSFATRESVQRVSKSATGLKAAAATNERGLPRHARETKRLYGILRYSPGRSCLIRLETTKGERSQRSRA